MGALEARGFAFHADAEAFVNIASPLMQPQRTSSHGSASLASPSSYFPTPGSPSAATQPLIFPSHEHARPTPSTPPPSTVAELQTRTFSLLAKRDIYPSVHPAVQVVQCAGRKDTLRAGTGTHASAELSQLRLQMGLMKCLYTVPRPKFFSVTLTDSEPASILLERSLLDNFACSSSSAAGGKDIQSVLIGNTEDTLVPISLDLRGLGMESTTGIVCGVAGAVVGAGMNSLTSSPSTSSPLAREDESSVVEAEGDCVDMLYLSTAMAGTVMVAEVELDRAVSALREAGRRGRERLSRANANKGTQHEKKDSKEHKEKKNDLNSGVEAMQIRGGFTNARDW